MIPLHKWIPGGRLGPNNDPRPQLFGRVPGSIRARQKRSRATRERLLAAVERVVRERGLARATVRAIAAQANVSVGTIYRRFPNKRALIETVRARFRERQRRNVMGPLRPGRHTGLSRRSALRYFVNRALHEIDRDRPLLEAFARDDYPGPEVFAALAARIGPPQPGSAGRIAHERRLTILELVLLALRGLVADGSEPPMAADAWFWPGDRWSDVAARG